MSVYIPRNRDMYLIDFVYQGKRTLERTAFTKGQKRDAQNREKELKLAVVKGELCLMKKRAAPTLHEFEKRFVASVETRSADKPLTIEFYKSKYSRLLEFTPLADCPLDRIDEALIESFVQHRRETVSPAETNRELATLRKALRLAYTWKVIDRVPTIRLLPGECERTYVLARESEADYLKYSPQPLHDVAVLILDSALRVSEAAGLEWQDTHLEPVNGARRGFIHVRSGKTKYAKRDIPLTARSNTMLESRAKAVTGRYVFPTEDGGPISRFTLRDQHAAVRKAMHLPADFVIHSLRHTALTRLGESGASAFQIQRIAGHSSVVVSQKYVHLSESLGSLIERTERAALPEANRTQTDTELPTKSPTRAAVDVGNVS